jgi:hypothetical protein
MLLRTGKKLLCLAANSFEELIAPFNAVWNLIAWKM